MVLFKKVLLFLIFTYALFVTDISMAQRGGFGPGRGLFGGPLHLGFQYDYFDPSEVQQFKGILAFRKLLGMPGGSTGRPRVLGYISTVNLAGGIRFLPDDSTDFRWRAGLLDANINTKNFIFGLTLIDYNQSDITKEQVQWFNGRFGLGRTIGNRKFSIRPQIAGAVGYSRLKFGSLNYPQLDQVADSTLSGLDAGFSTSLSIDIFSRFILSADFSERIIIDEIEPHFKRSGIQTSIRINKGWSNPLFLFLRYEKEIIKIATTSFEQENNRIFVGLSYTIVPSPPEKDPFDW